MDIDSEAAALLTVEETTAQLEANIETGTRSCG